MMIDGRVRVLLALLTTVAVSAWAFAWAPGHEGWMILVWTPVGLIAGRWWALVLPYSMVLALYLSGAGPTVPGETELWVGAMVPTTLVSVPLAAAGVLVSKMFDACRENRKALKLVSFKRD